MSERDILASTYFHVITKQIRHLKSETAWGETISEDKVVASNIKCAISKNSLNTLNTEKGIQTLTSTYTLFISDLVDIRESDIIIVDDVKYEIQDYFKYPLSHSEALLKRIKRV